MSDIGVVSDEKDLRYGTAADASTLKKLIKIPRRANITTVFLSILERLDLISAFLDPKRIMIGKRMPKINRL